MDNLTYRVTSTYYVGGWEHVVYLFDDLQHADYWEG